MVAKVFGICECFDVTSTKRARKRPLQRRLLVEKQVCGTYLELARKLGCSVSQAHDWATGKYEPTMGSFRKIARALECSVAELMGAA